MQVEIVQVDGHNRAKSIVRRNSGEHTVERPLKLPISTERAAFSPKLRLSPAPGLVE